LSRRNENESLIVKVVIDVPDQKVPDCTGGEAQERALTSPPRRGSKSDPGAARKQECHDDKPLSSFLRRCRRPDDCRRPGLGARLLDQSWELQVAQGRHALLRRQRLLHDLRRRCAADGGRLAHKVAFGDRALWRVADVRGRGFLALQAARRLPSLLLRASAVELTCLAGGGAPGAASRSTGSTAADLCDTAPAGSSYNFTLSAS